MEALAVVLAEAFGAQVRDDGTQLHTVIAANGGYFNARLRTSPVAEVFVTPRALDGFELTLRGERIRPESSFDHALNVSTNDHELARLWLDTTSRDALLASAYDYDTAQFLATRMPWEDPFAQPTLLVRRIWTYELANGELAVTKGAAEAHAERIAAVLETACTLVARCRRWAAEYAPIADRVGGTCRAEIELGGPPVITSTRAPIEVSLSLLRRLPGERTGRLRTLISAKRVGLHGETSYSLVNRSARSTMVPPLPDGSRRDFGIEDYRLRATSTEVPLDELAQKQLLAARPQVVAADLDSIDVWFDGAPMEADRLDAAFALAAHLAIGAAQPQGPYR